jgi:hypothetical protein
MLNNWEQRVWGSLASRPIVVIVVRKWESCYWGLKNGEHRPSLRGSVFGLSLRGLVSGLSLHGSVSGLSLRGSVLASRFATRSPASRSAARSPVPPAPRLSLGVEDWGEFPRLLWNRLSECYRRWRNWVWSIRLILREEQFSSCIGFERGY